MTRLFISYSSKNRKLIEHLVALLTKAGYEVTYDGQIYDGQWWPKILDDIRKCDIFLYVVTPEYLDSYPCDLEYQYAKKLDRPMCPTRLTALDFGRMPTHIVEDQVSDLSNLDFNNQSLPVKLIRTLNELALKPKPLPNPLPAEPPVPISKLNDVIERISDWNTPLKPPEQKTLLDEIRPLLYRKESRANARYALERYRKRAERDDEMLTRVTDEIDSLLSLTTGDATPHTGWRTQTTLWIGLVAIVILGIGGAIVFNGRSGSISVLTPVIVLAPVMTGVSSPTLLPTLTSTITATIVLTKTPLPLSATTQPSTTPTALTVLLIQNAPPASLTITLMLTQTLIPPTLTPMNTELATRLTLKLTIPNAQCSDFGQSYFTLDNQSTRTVRVLVYWVNQHLAATLSPSESQCFNSSANPPGRYTIVDDETNRIIGSFQWPSQKPTGYTVS